MKPLWEDIDSEKETYPFYPEELILRRLDMDC